ncbi:MAG: bifunctional riboflavin kinase/FAD synthetase [Alicyclobacillaceae bacterium]|nr:bifunctional riboflavin kinase/FAD synthetase [Alicyclobacillaceae bacterium]
METIRLVAGQKPPHPVPCVIALGTFDGVHIGHQQILAQGRSEALRRGVPFAVFLCDPHPRKVLGLGSQYDVQLTPLNEKLRLLEHYGADFVYILSFTREVAAIPPERFVLEVLVPLRPVVLVAGFDYTFGAGGRGDSSLLRAMGESRDIAVIVVPAVSRYGEKISSTLIREKLSYGDVALVRELLGRPYAVVGRVSRGEGRGRTLGFPTANLEMAERFVLPRSGVYAVRAAWGPEDHLGVMNIGVRPTFHDTGAVSAEVHILDWNADLYGVEMRVEFLDFLRPERKFSSAEELAAQIRRDAEEARRRWSPRN